jgi:hypothetical protein
MTTRTWLAAVGFALALALAGARCGRQVPLGVDPAQADGGTSGDAGAGPDGG